VLASGRARKVYGFYGGSEELCESVIATFKFFDKSTDYCGRIQLPYKLNSFFIGLDTPIQTPSETSQ
jgi:hypothetical protein